MECAKDYPITAEDIEQLQKRELPDKDSVKCLFACAYKKAGMVVFYVHFDLDFRIN